MTNNKTQSKCRATYMNAHYKWQSKGTLQTCLLAKTRRTASLSSSSPSILFSSSLASLILSLSFESTTKIRPESETKKKVKYQC